MKRNALALLAGASVVALLMGGCANKEVVKGEEGLVPKSETASTAASKPAEQPATPITQTRVAEQPAIAPANQPAKQSANVSAVETSFETVYFDFDKSDLRQDTRNALNRNAEVMLKSKPDAKIQVEGHCDERGSAEYNLALGERRAKSAVQYLITLGVKPERLSTISYGKEKPAVQGTDEAAWSKNRRAEFVIAK